jgi:hypothetical protein
MKILMAIVGVGLCVVVGAVLWLAWFVFCVVRAIRALDGD